jgi:hypothetical protein
MVFRNGKPVFREIGGDGWLCKSQCTYIFSDYGLSKLITNYRLGNCKITEKGLVRYSTNWY